MVVNKYCSKCGTKMAEEVKFCSECGEKTINREPSKEQKIIIQRKSSGGGWILAIIFIVILALIAFFVIQSGALDELTKGTGIKRVDPCERQFDSCNRQCGEGWGSGACKAKCTYDYNQCKGN